MDSSNNLLSALRGLKIHPLTKLEIEGEGIHNDTRPYCNTEHTDSEETRLLRAPLDLVALPTVQLDDIRIDPITPNLGEHQNRAVGPNMLTISDCLGEPTIHSTFFAPKPDSVEGDGCPNTPASVESYGSMPDLISVSNSSDTDVSSNHSQDVDNDPSRDQTQTEALGRVVNELSCKLMQWSRAHLELEAGLKDIQKIMIDLETHCTPPHSSSAENTARPENPQSATENQSIGPTDNMKKLTLTGLTRKKNVKKCVQCHVPRISPQKSMVSAVRRVLDNQETRKTFACSRCTSLEDECEYLNNRTRDKVFTIQIHDAAEFLSARKYMKVQLNSALIIPLDNTASKKREGSPETRPEIETESDWTDESDDENEFGQHEPTTYQLMHSSKEKQEPESSRVLAKPSESASTSDPKFPGKQSSIAILNTNATQPPSETAAAISSNQPEPFTLKWLELLVQGIQSAATNHPDRSDDVATNQASPKHENMPETFSIRSTPMTDTSSSAPETPTADTDPTHESHDAWMEAVLDNIFEPPADLSTDNSWTTNSSMSQRNFSDDWPTERPPATTNIFPATLNSDADFDQTAVEMQEIQGGWNYTPDYFSDHAPAPRFSTPSDTYFPMAGICPQTDFTAASEPFNHNDWTSKNQTILKSLQNDPAKYNGTTEAYDGPDNLHPQYDLLPQRIDDELHTLQANTDHIQVPWEEQLRRIWS
ncbi:hypothetical protein C8F04DRAFT_1267740 [Mycena alexandri]|uniref:Uncharacterized protein n=1 Tax=Mycena alexandri TaxID=1745969 RepID=A0AAD6SHC8_9AGAR|nr:hypothetical protein C8F04DRAFT_1277589 [Mycena alexandri]KAJ7026831.1 hypothetical protein C8F04DRAFT_1267740 [Mycena alexandri]